MHFGFDTSFNAKFSKREVERKVIKVLLMENESHHLIREKKNSKIRKCIFLWDGLKKKELIFLWDEESTIISMPTRIQFLNLIKIVHCKKAKNKFI